MQKYLELRKGYLVSPKGRLYKEYGDFRISLSFSEGKLSHLIFYGIDPESYSSKLHSGIQKGKIIETIEALHQHFGRIKKITGLYVLYADIQGKILSDLHKLWKD